MDYRHISIPAIDWKIRSKQYVPLDAMVLEADDDLGKTKSLLTKNLGAIQKLTAGKWGIVQRKCNSRTILSIDE